MCPSTSRTSATGRRRSGRSSAGPTEDTPPRGLAHDALTPSHQPGDPYEVARAVVLRALTLAPRSRAQLEEKLRRGNCPDDVASAVLDRMTEVGLVDDAAYAQMLVRSQQTGRGLARRALEHELRAKGIDDQTASQTLASVDVEDERARAIALVQRRVRSMLGVEPARQRRRLAAMLARRGYPGALAYSVVRDIVGGQGSSADGGDPNDGAGQNDPGEV